MSEIKTFIVSGKMLISHDHFPTWQKFNMRIRGRNQKDVIERVYTLLGSRHKLKRYHIKIEAIYEEEQQVENVTKQA